MIYWLHQTTSAIHFSSLQQGARTWAGGAGFFWKAEGPAHLGNDLAFREDLCLSIVGTRRRDKARWLSRRRGCVECLLRDWPTGGLRQLCFLRGAHCPAVIKESVFDRLLSYDGKRERVRVRASETERGDCSHLAEWRTDRPADLCFADFCASVMEKEPTPANSAENERQKWIIYSSLLLSRGKISTKWNFKCTAGLKNTDYFSEHSSWRAGTAAPESIQPDASDLTSVAVAGGMHC